MSSEWWVNYVTAFPESGTPTQEEVDQSFKFFADILTYCDSIEWEIESFKHASYQERKEKLEKLKSKIEDDVKPKVEEKNKEEAEENPILKKLNEKKAILEKLINPPTSIDDVIGYLKSIADYFMEPYLNIIKIMAFYYTYMSKYGIKYAETIARLISVISLLASELANLDVEAGKYKKLSIAELEEERLSQEKEMKVVRYKDE